MPEILIFIDSKKLLMSKIKTKLLSTKNPAITEQIWISIS